MGAKAGDSSNFEDGLEHRLDRVLALALVLIALLDDVLVGVLAPRAVLARLHGLVRAKVIDTAFQGVFDPLVGFGLATKERLPLEYRDV